ncbi:MAG: helix-turn-helix transcriptional regulator [Candidatus Pacebacteria bacterium]|nr:helix-turn-helix transcriptional regulator [Candidatus Paceibacterota bacterium]
MNEHWFFTLWGTEFRRIREAAGLSQTELAEKLQTTQKQVSRVESGSNPTLATIMKWYIACGQEPPVPDKPCN